MSLHTIKSSEKIRCDIYYTNIDLTSLRWLTEVKNVIIPFKNIFDVKFHKHTTNSIIFDNQSINLHDLKELLFESLLQTILNDNS